MQRVRGAVHADAQGTVPLSPPVPRPRGGTGDHRRVHRAVQRRVDRRAPGVPNARPDAARCAQRGRMRGYLTIDPVAARGSYSISVRRGSAVSSASGPGAQETGCGTRYTTVQLTPLTAPRTPLG